MLDGFAAGRLKDEQAPARKMGHSVRRNGSLRTFNTPLRTSNKTLTSLTHWIHFFPRVIYLDTKTGIHCDACHHLHHHFFVIHGFARAFPVVGHMFPLELAMDTTVTNRAACPPGRQTLSRWCWTCKDMQGHARPALLRTRRFAMVIQMGWFATKILGNEGRYTSGWPGLDIDSRPNYEWGHHFAMSGFTWVVQAEGSRLPPRTHNHSIT